MPALEPYDSDSVMVDDLKNQLQDVAKAKGRVHYASSFERANRTKVARHLDKDLALYKQPSFECFF